LSRRFFVGVNARKKNFMRCSQPSIETVRLYSGPKYTRAT
jgi:hypothetical protein